MIMGPTVVGLRRASVQPTVPRRAKGQGTLASAKVASAPKSGPVSLTGDEPSLGSSPAGLGRPERSSPSRQVPSTAERRPPVASQLSVPAARSVRATRASPGRRAKTGVRALKGGAAAARSLPRPTGPRHVGAQTPWAGWKRKAGIPMFGCRPLFCEPTGPSDDPFPLHFPRLLRRISG